jgi:hypothetical protein
LYFVQLTLLAKALAKQIIYKWEASINRKRSQTLTEEKLEFTQKLLVLGNLGLLAWVFLAFLGILFYNQIYGWLYLLLEAVVIYLILRRIGCSSCYKCKTCTSGFGRLAGAFFGKGYIKKESVGNRLGLIAFVYFMLLPLPATILLFSFSQAFSFLKVLVLVCLLAIAIYSLTTWSNRSTVKRFTKNKDLGEVLNG